VEYVNGVQIARELFVSAATIRAWRRQYHARSLNPFPKPNKRGPAGMWLWKAERRQEWLDWYTRHVDRRKPLVVKRPYHCACCSLKVSNSLSG
jgi:hypothetical protein